MPLRIKLPVQQDSLFKIEAHITYRSVRQRLVGSILYTSHTFLCQLQFVHLRHGRFHLSQRKIKKCPRMVHRLVISRIQGQRFLFCTQHVLVITRIVHQIITHPIGKLGQFHDAEQSLRLTVRLPLHGLLQHPDQFVRRLHYVFHIHQLAEIQISAPAGHDVFPSQLLFRRIGHPLQRTQ